MGIHLSATGTQTMVELDFLRVNSGAIITWVTWFMTKYYNVLI
jgi:hypothetical protein